MLKLKRFEYIILLASLFLVNTLSAQRIIEPEIDWNPERTLYTFTYDLDSIPNFNYYNVVVEGKDNNVPIPMKSLTGDFGDKQKAGKNKKIYWSLRDDIDGFQGEFTVRLIVTPDSTDMVISKPPDPPPIENIAETQKQENNKINTAAWIGLGGSVAAGTALIVVGSIKVSDGNELYNTYDSNRDEYDEVYDDKTRNEYYDEANSKFKTGQILIISGSAILVGGGFYFINKLIKSKNADKSGKGDVSYNLTPVFHQGNNRFQTSNKTLAGSMFSVVIRF